MIEQVPSLRAGDYSFVDEKKNHVITAKFYFGWRGMRIQTAQMSNIMQKRKFNNIMINIDSPKCHVITTWKNK